MKFAKQMCYSTLIACAALASICPAQGQAFGGGGMPPAIMAKIKLWQKWNESHKNITNLGTMLYQVREMDKSPEDRLTKPQAHKLLAILKSWRNKPTMSDDQAKGVSKQIGAILTVKQIKKMTTLTPPWMRRGGMGGGGGARPAGAARPGGFTFPDPPAGGYNPLNPDKMPFPAMRPQMKKGLDDFEASLAQR
ncbi:MAG TPA: hypothetical protein VGS41_01700 [Chthonomonadales bacterium]|nr:hypothetical protein [Chthonomonadales bacterium]